MAICQLVTLNYAFSGGGMDVDTAIQEFNLDNQECLKLAQREGLDFIADKIKERL